MNKSVRTLFKSLRYKLDMISEQITKLFEMFAGRIIDLDVLTHSSTPKYISRIRIVFRQRVPNEYQGFTLGQYSFNLSPNQSCFSCLFLQFWITGKKHISKIGVYFLCIWIVQRR